MRTICTFKKITSRWLPCLALVFASVALAEEIRLTWTNATLNTDNTPIPTDPSNPLALASSTAFYNRCVDANSTFPQEPFNEQTYTTTVPGQQEERMLTVNGSGRWCVVMVHTNNAGAMSDLSNSVAKVTSALAPMPPTNFTVSK